MNRMHCTHCKNDYYSGAARQMIDAGESCDCGARLIFAGPEPVQMPQVIATVDDLLADILGTRSA